MKSASVPDTTGYDPASLIATHQAGVWRYLRALGCESALADDLTQETFLAVLQVPFRELSRAATTAYLRKTAHNLYVSHQRRSRRMVATAEIEALDRTWIRWTGNGDGESVLEALKECLEVLRPRARLALELRFRDCASRLSIAQVLQMSEHGAKNLMQRAKRKLRECVESKMQ